MTISRLWCRYNGVVGILLGLGILVWAGLSGDAGPAGLGVLAMGLGVSRLWAARCAVDLSDADVSDRSQPVPGAPRPLDRAPR